MNRLVPRLEKRAICYANDPKMAACISSYFCDKDTYFAVFPFPRFDDEDKSKFAVITTDRHEALINNRILMLKPDFVTLAGLTPRQWRSFDKLPKSRVISIADLAEIPEKLGRFVDSDPGHHFVHPQFLADGLRSARTKGLRVVIDERAVLCENSSSLNKALLVAEDANDIHSVVAANYAHAINADLRLIRTPIRGEQDEFNYYLGEFKRSRKTNWHDLIRRFLLKRLPEIDLVKYDYLIFSTESFPYGFAFPTKITCHVQRRFAYQTIFDNLIYESADEDSASGLVFAFAPSNFQDQTHLSLTEVDEVVNRFSDSGFLVQSLRQSDATIENFGNLAEYLPYDTLHVCSHGGTLPAVFVRRAFTDRNGVEHVVEYYEIMTVYPLDEQDETGDDMFMLGTKVFPHAIDGHNWGSEELAAQCPKYVLDDFFELIAQVTVGEDEEIHRRKTDYHPPSSSSIACNDGNHQCAFGSLAAMGSPFIFNNSCSSWLEIGKTVIALGARGYLGTLWDVSNQTATSCAKGFYKRTIEDNTPIAQAVSEINQRIALPGDLGVYIFWGLHFAKLRKPERSKDSLIRNVRRLIDRSIASYWDFAENTSYDEEVRKNALRIVEFLNTARTEIN